MDHLRSYLVKWSHVDSQLESMWEALKARGFALPVTLPEPIASDSSLSSQSQLAPTPSGPSATSTALNSRSSANSISKAESRMTKQNAVGDSYWILAGQVEKPSDKE
ncbi:hypothetical protein FRC06_009198, partial [Ceratobasidium sp. 370]